MSKENADKARAILAKVERLVKSQNAMRLFMEKGLGISGRTPFNAPYFQKTLVSAGKNLGVVEPLMILYVFDTSVQGGELVELRNVPQGEGMNVLMTTSYLFAVEVNEGTGKPPDLEDIISSKDEPDLVYVVPKEDDGILGVRIFVSADNLDSFTIPLGVDQTEAVENYPVALSRASQTSGEIDADTVKKSKEKAGLLLLVGRALTGGAPLRGKDTEEEDEDDRGRAPATNARDFYAVDDFRDQI